MKTITTNSTSELLAVLEQPKRDGHHVTTLATGKTNAQFIVTIDEGPAQPELIPERVGSSRPTNRRMFHALRVLLAANSKTLFANHEKETP